MTLQFKNYTTNLSKGNEENKFLLPWGGVLLRNCDSLGDLLSFKSVAQYRDQEQPLWLVLSLVLFRDNVWHFKTIFCTKKRIFFRRGNCSKSIPVAAVLSWRMFLKCGWNKQERSFMAYSVFILKLQILSSHLGRITGL